PVQGSVCSGRRLRSSMEKSSGSDFISQYFMDAPGITIMCRAVRPDRDVRQFMCGGTRGFRVKTNQNARAETPRIRFVAVVGADEPAGRSYSSPESMGVPLAS